MLWLLACSSFEEPPVLVEDVHLTWLGVTSFIVQYDDKAILLDSFFSRPKLGGNEGASDEGIADFWAAMTTVGLTHLDAILIGHSHYDHAIDVGPVALQTGAQIYGSQTTCLIAEAQGVASEKCTIVGQEDVFSIGSMTVDVARTIHWWPEQGGIGGAYEVFTEPPDPEHLFIVPHGGVLSYLLTFTDEPGAPTLLFQDSLGAIDADDDSNEDYSSNLHSVLQGRSSITVWMTCVDCAEVVDEFQPYVDIIQPKNILAMHFDGLMPDVEQGLQESFQEPEWYPSVLEHSGAVGLYPSEYFQRFILRDGHVY